MAQSQWCRGAGDAALYPGGEVQIGETRIRFDTRSHPAPISATPHPRTTPIFSPDEYARMSAEESDDRDLDSRSLSRTDLLGLISKVGVALLSSTGLDDTLDQVASLVFEAVPAERVIIMCPTRKQPEDMQSVARMRGRMSRSRRSVLFPRES